MKEPAYLRKCSVESCESILSSHGLCMNHNYRRRKYGDPTAKTPPRSDKGTGMKQYKKEYDAYRRMITRCYDKAVYNYENYGGRGIKVCDRWLEPKKVGFYIFLSDMGKRPNSDYSIDRIDVNGNYSPENCRWANHEVQANNRRNNVYITAQGKTLTMAQWARLLNISYDRIKGLRKRHDLSDEALINRASSVL